MRRDRSVRPGWGQRKLAKLRHALRRWTKPRRVKLHGVWLSCDPKDVPSSVIDLIYREQYERAEAWLCRSVVKPTDRVLELGGGIGFIGSVCARICGSDRVTTYEANPQMESMIRQTHDMNGLTPDLRMRAIAQEAGEICFYLNDNVISSSLVDRDFGGQQTVACDALADVLQEVAPTTLVCDIEGAEVDLLMSVDLSTIQKIIIELHPKIVGDEANDRLITHLESQGLKWVQGKRSKVVLFTRG